MTQGSQRNKIAGLNFIRTLPIRTGTVSLLEGQILYFQFLDEITLTVEDVIELSDTNLALTGSDMYFSIVVPGFRNDLTKEAREYDFYKELNRKPTCIAEAIIVKELPTRIVVDFYYKFRAFPYPTKAFASEDKALEWFKMMRPFTPLG